MNVGTIVYYILWPIVAMMLLVYWIFIGFMFLLEFGVECIQNFHNEIKEF
jgi:hypothetical protein